MSPALLYSLLVLCAILTGGVIYLFMRHERLKFAHESLKDENHALRQETELNAELLAQNKKERDAHAMLLARSDALEFPVWMRNEQLHIIYYNKAYADMAGILPGIATVTELCDGAKELAASVLETQKKQSFNEHLIASGERCLYSISEVPLEIKETQAATMGYAISMTELEDKEQELELLMNAQAKLLESTSHAIAIYDSATRLKFYNDAFTRLWGIEEPWLDAEPSYGDVLERLREMRKLPEQADFKEYKKQALAQFNNLIERQETFLYLPDEQVLRVVTIPHGHGGLIFSYEDMTEHVKLEREYNTLMSVKKSTIDHLFEGIVVFKQNGRMQLCNPAFARMWNLHESFLETEPHVTDVFEKIRPNLPSYVDAEAYKMELFTLLETRETTKKRIELNTGTVIDRVSVPLPDGDTLLTYTDVSDSTKLERSLRAEKNALEEAAQLKTTFLSNVSYELRSPLTSILGFSEALLKKYFGALEPKQEEYVENIHASSLELSNLIDNILEMTAYDAGTLKLNMSRFNVEELSAALASEYQTTCSKKDIIFNALCDDAIEIEADKQRLKHALSNLIENAIEHSEKEGSVTLSIAKNDDGTMLDMTVSDTGKGIGIEEQMEVFNRFYKSNTLMGVGLGLPIVKAFAELHGGDVDLRSTPQQGTVVSIHIPIS